jgi:large subunit ribosomal protein L19
MSKLPIVLKLEQSLMKPNAQKEKFQIGDTIRIHIRIVEGEKERIQIFTGTVIARNGYGLSESFTVHRVAFGEGMERVFLLQSPLIAKIEVTKRGQVRRSKLYHLRGTSGKAAKVKGRIGGLNNQTSSKKSDQTEAAVSVEETKA